MDYNYEFKGNLVSIRETQTNYIIKENLTKEEAKPIIRHLNFGGGFGGWTPNFFLKKIDHIQERGEE